MNAIFTVKDPFPSCFKNSFVPSRGSTRKNSFGGFKEWLSGFSSDTIGMFGWSSLIFVSRIFSAALSARVTGLPSFLISVFGSKL